MEENESGNLLDIDPIGNIDHSWEEIEPFPKEHTKKQLRIKQMNKSVYIKEKKNKKERLILKFNWFKKTEKTYEQQINEACLIIKYIAQYNFGEIIQMALYMKEVYSNYQNIQDTLFDDLEPKPIAE